MGLPASRNARLIAFPQGAQGLHGRLATALKHHRLPESLIAGLIHDAECWPGYAPHEALACALAQRMRPEAIDLVRTCGLLLVGPAGAGKSAVAAKLAWAAARAGRKARIASLAEAPKLTHDCLTLVEARGFNPVSRRAVNAFAALAQSHDMEAVGVVSATADAQDVSDILAALKPRRVIVTGLDRAMRLGAAVAAATGAARLAHVTAGPRASDPLQTLEPGDLARQLLAPMGAGG